MIADTHSWCPIETINWETLAPTYPFRFNGPAYLYCRWCTHFIRLVCRTKTGVKCSDCGQNLAMQLLKTRSMFLSEKENILRHS